jgi:hypothetical protein
MMTMQNESENEALSVLREVFEQVKPNASWELVEKSYEIERHYQFDSDRDVAVSNLRRLVTQHVADEIDATASSEEGSTQ